MSVGLQKLLEDQPVMLTLMPYLIGNFKATSEQHEHDEHARNLNNMLKLNEIVHSDVLFATRNKALPNPASADKVMHENPIFGYICHTLSGGTYADSFTNRTGPRLPVHGTAMLDDRTACSQNELFRSFHPSVFERNGILQQFHSQREMVHPPFDPPIRPRRLVVSPRYRILQGRQPHQHSHPFNLAESCRYDGGDAGRETPLPLPHDSGSTLPKGKASAGEGRKIPCLSCRGSTYRERPTPIYGHEKTGAFSTSRRDCGVGTGDVYPQSQSQLQKTGQNSFNILQRHSRHCSDRKVFRSTRAKKNHVNCSAHAFQLLSGSLERLSQETLPSVLFPEPPIIPFVPDRKVCLCGRPLVVQKTRRKTVLSLTGPFIAHETLLHCSECSRVFDSDDLLVIVPSRCNVAYDVMVFIGRALFLRHRNTEEVCAELVLRNVRLCASEIDYLGRKFISFLAMAHRQATPRIRRRMTLVGGYILHLDATHEGNAPVLMIGLDGLSKFVLANVKVPSESSTYISPFLREIKKTYGTPGGCVHDMGTGLCKAVAAVFPHTPDFICHFHFLRDIGKDYLEPAYRELRNHLRSHASTSRLRALVRDARQRLIDRCAQISGLAKVILSADLPKDMPLLSLGSSYSLPRWALQGKHSGDGYGFPFDLPLLNFTERILYLDIRLPEILEQHPNEDWNQKKPLVKLARVVSDVAKDSMLQSAVKELHWRSKIFNSLRKAMRIAPIGGSNGLNDDGASEAMSTIQQGVESFRLQLDENPELAADPLSHKMAEQIDKYGDKLFADPIEVDTPTGKVTIFPQRTNNILEQFFRDLKRGQRRKTGNNSMSRMLRSMLADTPLVKNLENPEYMEILLDGNESLEKLFSELGKSHSTADIQAQAGYTDCILPGFKAVIKIQDLPDLVLNLFKKFHHEAKSN